MSKTVIDRRAVPTPPAMARNNRGIIVTVTRITTNRKKRVLKRKVKNYV